MVILLFLELQIISPVEFIKAKLLVGYDIFDTALELFLFLLDPLDFPYLAKIQMFDWADAYGIGLAKGRKLKELTFAVVFLVNS